MKAPEVIRCPQCDSSAHYVGTQDSVRFYVCDNNPQHLIKVRP